VENRKLLGFLDWAAAALCVFAGLYLLSRGSADIPGGGQSWFEALGHGIGIYFLGKGVFVGRSAYLAGVQAERLRQLVELAALGRQEPEVHGRPDLTRPVHPR